MIINPYRHFGSFEDTTSWALGGLDDYLDSTTAFDTIQADSGMGADVKWSVVFWLKLDNLTGDQYLYDIRDGSGTLVQNLYVNLNGRLQAFMTGSGSNWSRTATGVITAGNWHLISMVYDGTLGRYDRQKVYADADRTGETSNFYSANHAQSSSITLGATSVPSNHTEGHINEIAVWYGTALSQGQLEDIYNSGGPALDLTDIDGLPSPTHWFRSENAVWDPSDPTDEHFIINDEMGTAKELKTNNMPEVSRDADVPT